MAIYPDTDKTMLERVIHGDDVNWQAFYDRYSPIIRTLARTAQLPAARIDDVVQEVMSRFSRNGSTYVYAPERARFRTYFNRLVRGAISDEFRRLVKQNQLACSVLPLDESVSPEWEIREMEAWRSAVLEDALHQLSGRVSASNYLAFSMSSLQGRSIAETAEFLGITAAQVYQARRRCLALLQEIVRRCNESDPELNLKVLPQ